MPLEEISLAQEEAFLRTPLSHELACLQGIHCVGMNLTPQSSPLVRFVTPRGIQHPNCLLCIRKKITDQWYEGRELIEQPWYVKAETFGEYHGDMLLPPTLPMAGGRYLGITH